MATFTNAQLLSLMETISGSGLTAKQLSKKTSKAQKMLSKRDPDFDKIVALFNTSSTDTRLKRPQNRWQLFLADHRDGLEPGMSGKEQTQSASTAWAEMDEEAKLPYTERAAKLSAEYKAKLAELKASKEDSNSTDNSDANSDESEPDEDDLPLGEIKPKKGTKADKPKSVKKPKAEVDAEFWGDLDELEWTRYELDDKHWEFVTKDNQYLIREGEGDKQKIMPREMKSEKAVQKSIASQIEKKENLGFTLV